MAKKEPKKAKPKAKGQEKSPKSAELSEDQLEQVAGGAQLDAFLQLDGIKGETQVQKHKELIEYQPANPLPIKLFKI